MKVTIVIENGKVSVEVDDGQAINPKTVEMPGSTIMFEPLPSQKLAEGAADFVHHEPEKPHEPKEAIHKKGEPARRCIYCNDVIESASKAAKVCKKPECKKAQQREYTRKWAEKKGLVAKIVPAKPVEKPPVKPEFLPGHEKTNDEIESWRPTESTPEKTNVNDKPAGADWFCIHCKKWGMHKSPDCPFVDHAHPATRQRESDEPFDDPWNCQMCRNEGHLCDLHDRLDKDGKKPPKRWS